MRPYHGLDEIVIRRAVARLLVALANTLVLPALLAGQTLTGRVVRDSAAAVGVVVSLVDRDGHAVSRAVSNESGAFTIAAPAAGTYRVEVLQIGWRPTFAGPFVLRASATSTARIALTSSRIPLATVVVTGTSECRVRPDSGTAAFAIWDEARKALLAASLTAHEQLAMTMVRSDQTFDVQGTKLIADTTRQQVIPTLDPFVSRAADSLVESGYMTRDATGASTFWAPDARVLLSTAFISSHCLQVDSGVHDASSRGSVALTFKPTGRSAPRVDIAGTVWVDRETAELRAVDFQYVNLPRAAESANAGGRVEFLRVPGGRWIVDGWHIRMPVLGSVVSQSDAPIPGVSRGARVSERLFAVKVASALISSIAQNGVVLWERGKVSASIRVVDSVSGEPLRGVLVRVHGASSAFATDSEGVVRLNRLLPGAATLDLESPSLRSVGLAPLLARVNVPAVSDAVLPVAVPSPRDVLLARCGARAVEWNEGLVAGTLGNVSGDARVIVAWSTPYTRLGGGEPVLVTAQRRVNADSIGRFELCGIPRDAMVTVRRASGDTTPVTARFPSNEFAVAVRLPAP